jgi:hypothetical protein
MHARDARQSFAKRATRDGDASGAQESSTRLNDAGRRAGVTVGWDQAAGRVMGSLEWDGMRMGIDMGACMYAQVTCKRASY